MNSDIPKVIHYCWFGGKPKPELAKKCIDSWKKYCPDYKIIEWNESNFDIELCKYVKEAYKEKRWAFVSDYARFWILYNHGGIYMDTDVELIKSIDDIVEAGTYMGCEPAMRDMNGRTLNSLKYLVNPGLGLAAPAGHLFLKEIIENYNTRSFYKTSGELDLTTVVQTTTNLLLKYGYKGSNKLKNVANINIYPSDFFCPKNYFSGELCITSNTKSIHHYSASWQSDKERKQLEVLQKFNAIFGKKIGYKVWRCYTLPKRIENKMRMLGTFGTIKFVFGKFKEKLL